MLSTPELAQVECETHDDIVLVREGFSEYIQVKTTEGNTKWSQTEVIERGSQKLKPTSLIEKSLLCDQRDQLPRFRIISRRDVNKKHLPFKVELDKRIDTSCEELGTKFAKQLKTTSVKGRDLIYWAKNAVWQVVGDADALTARNQQQLSHLAEQYGVNPTHSHVIEIYRDLLNVVDEAALASKVTAPEKKIITRETALAWWQKHLENTSATARRHAKPYGASSDPFFAELHSLSEEDIHRALTGYDAQFEIGKWRSKELAVYLADWLPEAALKASELVEVNHLNLREKLASAMAKVRASKTIELPRLMAEMLLHAVMRHRFESEPIACKLFYQADSGMKTFGNAHIVHAHPDQLWLGKGTVCTALSYEAVIAALVAELEGVLDPDFLKAERQVILTLREPQHLRPTTLEGALKRNTPVDDLLKVLSIALLVAYDSEVLSTGFAADYREILIAEVTTRYYAIKPVLPEALQHLHVHIFLVPIECVNTLTRQFEAEIRNNQ